MYDNMKIKYLFINLRYPAYVKLQASLIIGWLIGAAVCFIFLSESGVWWMRNGWWLCIVIGILEGVESQIAIKKAKDDFNTNTELSS